MDHESDESTQEDDFVAGAERDETDIQRKFDEVDGERQEVD